MKPLPVILAIGLLAVCLRDVAYGQAAPAATSAPTTPTLNVVPAAGVLSYNLGASESILFGYNGDTGVSSDSIVSGGASFVSNSQQHPLSFLYSAGYIFGDNTGQANSTYQNFGISQVFNTRRFSFLIGDNVNYLPNSPVFNLSGIPGVGDIGTAPIGTGSVPTSSILTYFGRQVTNTVHGSATDRLTGSTSLTAFGDYTILRFPDNNGINDNEVDGGASLSHRVSGDNTFGAGYVYSNFSYLPGPYTNALSGGNIAVTSQEANLQYQHVFSPQLMLAASAGPQRTSSSNSALLPASTSLAADLSLFYKARSTSYLLSFTRGTSSGSGVLIGALSNNVDFSVNHTFSPNWNGSYSANYDYASGLEYLGGTNITTSGFYTGIQARRQLGRYFSAYGSYSLEFQSLSRPVNEVNAFSGTEDVIGFGITYSPRPIHLGHP